MAKKQMTTDERIENLEANIGNLMGHISILRLINFRLMDHLKADCEAEFSLIISHLKGAQKHHEQNAKRNQTPYYDNIWLSFSDTLDHLEGTRLPPAN